MVSRVESIAIIADQHYAIDQETHARLHGWSMQEEGNRRVDEVITLVHLLIK